MKRFSSALGFLKQWDALIASLALLGMVLTPVVEVLLRPIQGSGIENAPVLVQHLGLIFSLAGAIYAERTGHLTSLGSLWKEIPNAQIRAVARGWVFLGATLICGVLAQASFELVSTEIDTQHTIAYGFPTWLFLCAMPFGFTFLGLKFCIQWHDNFAAKCVGLLSMGGISWHASQWMTSSSFALAPLLLGFGILVFLVLGGPVFLVLGGLSWLLFSLENIPMASLALSHYQITVNPSLPALPLFTLAGLIFANTGAAHRLSQLFTCVFGSGQKGSILAVACLCSCFTALTGGSGVTILALGGLMLPLLFKVGYPESKGIGLITSASSLGVLLAPSVPLIMYAIMARVPINTMFIAGLVPAVIMVLSLILFGGFFKLSKPSNSIETPTAISNDMTRLAVPMKNAVLNAKWEIIAPFIAICSLVSGIATPTEGAAITVAYALLTQGLVHRELTFAKFQHCLKQSAQIIGGILLIMGMALGLTNYLIDVGIPDLASDWVQSVTQNKYVFLLALNVFLFFAGALMEIFAAIIVLVPLLLPLAMSYGIDPVHFGIIFLANLEMGFLCPPAGMNIYFASAVFKKSLKEVMQSVLPALFAIFIGTVLLSWFPLLVMTLPQLLLS